MKHVNITIYGRVQRVSFRAATKAVADQLGIRGYVQNKPDGTVYLEAEGDELSVGFMLDWCNDGPEKAVVEKVEVVEAELKNYRNFEVKK